jgi:hypothetical protein
LKRIALAVSVNVLVLILALVFAAFSSAYSASGRTVYNSNGAGFPGASVTIYDATRGTNGGTTSDSSGNYSFGGLVTNDHYYLQATGCQAHTSYAAAPVFYGGNGALPTLRMIATGSC